MAVLLASSSPTQPSLFESSGKSGTMSKSSFRGKMNMNILEEAREALRRLLDEHGLAGEKVSVTTKALKPEEAIGSPARGDYALLEGKEVMVEADFKGSRGHSFTDAPWVFEGTLSEVMGLDLSKKHLQAIFVAAMNAVTRHLGLAEKTVHCRDDEPEKCGEACVRDLKNEFGNVKVAQIGFQPAMLYHLVNGLTASSVRCSDLNRKNVGTLRNDVTIEDGETSNDELIDWCDIVFVTSSTMVNGTFDAIYKKARAADSHVITFGVSGAGISALLGIRRYCGFGH